MTLRTFLLIDLKTEIQRVAIVGQGLGLLPKLPKTISSLTSKISPSVLKRYIVKGTLGTPYPLMATRKSLAKGWQGIPFEQGRQFLASAVSLHISSPLMSPKHLERGSRAWGRTGNQLLPLWGMVGQRNPHSSATVWSFHWLSLGQFFLHNEPLLHLGGTYYVCHIPFHLYSHWTWTIP